VSQFVIRKSSIVNPSFPGLSGKKQWAPRIPFMVVSWKYQPQNEKGMPSDSDWERMVSLENLLESLETKRAAFMMISVTCNGTKEWQWYSRDSEEYLKYINSALSGQEPFPIEISQEEDPEWSEHLGIKSMGNKTPSMLLCHAFISGS
jgi:hypothetical protein